MPKRTVKTGKKKGLSKRALLAEVKRLQGVEVNLTDALTQARNESGDANRHLATVEQRATDLDRALADAEERATAAEAGRLAAEEELTLARTAKEGLEAALRTAEDTYRTEIARLQQKSADEEDKANYRLYTVEEFAFILVFLMSQNETSGGLIKRILLESQEIAANFEMTEELADVFEKAYSARAAFSAASFNELASMIDARHEKIDDLYRQLKELGVTAIPLS